MLAERSTKSWWREKTADDDYDGRLPTTERTDLHVEMNDAAGMNELNAFTNLSHDTDASFLRQQKVFADRSIE